MALFLAQRCLGMFQTVRSLAKPMIGPSLGRCQANGPLVKSFCLQLVIGLGHPRKFAG